jgi:hypothetical protein
MGLAHENRKRESGASAVARHVRRAAETGKDVVRCSGPKDFVVTFPPRRLVLEHCVEDDVTVRDRDSGETRTVFAVDEVERS